MRDMTEMNMMDISRPEFQNRRPVEVPERLKELCLMHKEELLRRAPGSHKGSYGRLLIIAGSPGMAGAAYLSGLAAFRAGIGMVRYLGPEENRVILQTLLPEAMYESLPDFERCTSACYDQDHAPAKGIGHGDPAAAHFSDVQISKTATCPDNRMRAGAAEDVVLCKLLSALSWADYLIVGPGLSRSDAARALIHGLFTKEATGKLQAMKLIVLDADALNIMAEEGLDPGALNIMAKENPDPGALTGIAQSGRKNTPSDAVPAPYGSFGKSGVEAKRETDADDSESAARRIVITPHMMEMSRLCLRPLEEIRLRPEETALQYAAEHQVTVVLKDAVTTVSDGRETMQIASGCAAMAKAGSGDVLTGCIAGTAAMLHGNIADAVPLAVHLHGTAGRIAASIQGSQSILARDIAESMGKALREITV